MEIKFPRDTSFRKQFFVPDSFAHPAKMDAQLLIWIVERYTKVGEVILDPMGGSGTLMLGCMVGRHVILVELEQKFIKMCCDNWEIVRMHPQLGFTMGNCQIIQGDARNLTGLLVDKCIFSPPFSTEHPSGLSDKTIKATEKSQGRRYSRRSFTGGENYGLGKDNIGNLPYGSIDKIVTSPPYAEAQSGGGIAQEGYTKGYQPDKIRGGNIDPVGKRSYMPENVGVDPDNISNLPYGSIDKIVTSPPYEGSEARDRSSEDWWDEEREKSKSGGSAKIAKGYQASGNNIGNLKGETYLSAMLQVYQQCHSVLKPQGLMVLVTKNFIRNKQIVRLDLDTIKLCEQAGFGFLERHYRKLPAQSFWRTIYRQKYPEAPEIKFEDILVFTK